MVIFDLKHFTKRNLGFLSNLPLVIFGSERVKASECDNSNIDPKILSSLGSTVSESSRLQEKRL